MNVYEYNGGWIDCGRWTFQWVARPQSKPCYIVPYSRTSVPIGIDGLEFV